MPANTNYALQGTLQLGHMLKPLTAKSQLPSPPFGLVEDHLAPQSKESHLKSVCVYVVW